MTHSSSKLSVGLIVRSGKLWHWQSVLIDGLLGKGLMDVNSVLLIDQEPLMLPQSIAYLHAIDAALFRSPMNAFGLVEIDCPQPIDYYSLEQIETAGIVVDCWLNFSEKPVPESLLKTAKIGALEMHFSKNPSPDALNSAYFGYAAFARSERQCYFAIVAHHASGSAVLTESFPSLDAGPLSRNMNQYWKSIGHAWVRICRNLQTHTLDQLSLKSVQNQCNDRVCNDLKPMSAYRNLAGIFANKLSQKFLRKEQWVLLLQFQSTDELPLAFADYCEISPPGNCFWADPFIISHDDRHYVFFEELPFETEQGHLSCMEVFADGSYTKPKIILKEPYHLSYPNVFFYESYHYMVPESGDAGSIVLYRSTSFPYQWERQHVLMNDVHAYDSTLIEFQGTWWLFACIAAEKGLSGNEELHVFYADSPLSQDWQPHPHNPVISDASCARPAGKFFMWQGELYRPSQDCAGSYGAGLNINRVNTLNKQVYEEAQAHYAKPDWDPKLTALHTLNFNQHVSVADAMRVDSRFF